MIKFFLRIRILPLMSYQQLELLLLRALVKFLYFMVLGLKGEGKNPWIECLILDSMVSE